MLHMRSFASGLFAAVHPASTRPPMPAMPRSLWWPIAARLPVDQLRTGLRGPLNRVAGEKTACTAPGG